MRRIAPALLTAFLLAAFSLLTSPAKAGDYEHYDGGGYYSDGSYGDSYYSDVGYYGHRFNDDGYSYRHRHYGNTWTTSSCCYRKVVRHTAWYERTYRQAYYDGDGYYRHRHYGDYDRPYYHRHYGDYYRPYYHRYYGDYYRRYYHRNYRSYYRPYYHHYYGDYVYRPYRYYDLGYASASYAGYDGCGRIPLADGRGGWVWSRRAGCF